MRFRFGIVLIAACVFAAAALAAWSLMPYFLSRKTEAGPGVTQTLSPPPTRRLDAELREALTTAARLEEEAAPSQGQCLPCATAWTGVRFFGEEARRAMAQVRRLERRQGDAARMSEIRDDTHLVEGQLSAARETAGVSILGYRHFLDAYEQCRIDAGCAGTPAVQQTAFSCRNEEPMLRAALARVSALASAVEKEADTCNLLSCPLLDCKPASALMEDLAVAEEALVALSKGVPLGAGGGVPRRAEVQADDVLLAVAGLEETFRTLAHGPDEPQNWREVRVEASRMAGDLSSLAQEAELADESDTVWRLRTIVLALSRAERFLRLAAEEIPARSLGLEALADAMLDSARLVSALRQQDAAVSAQAARPDENVCATADLLAALHAVKTARAGYQLCWERSTCRPKPEEVEGEGKTSRPIRSREAALEALTGGLPLDPRRSLAAGVRPAPSPQLNIPQTEYKQGEVVRLDADFGPGSCLAEGGYLSLNAQGEPVLSQTYALSGEPGATMLFAPEEPGTHELGAYANLDRGGGLLALRRFEVTPLPDRCEGFTGLWETDVGELHLIERDGSATGSYRREPGTRPGFVLGTVQGSRFEGIWISEIARGKAEFVLSGDGESFSGRWTLGKSGKAGGAWNGACVASSEEP